MAQDIAVPVGDYFLDYRVAAIIQWEGSVLIDQFMGQDFWFLPGGRV